MNSMDIKNYKKRKSLAGKFRLSFVLIVSLSIIFSMITYFLIMIMFNFAINSEKINPANYYENKLPIIENYIQSEGENILLNKNKEKLDKIIKGYNFYYKVVDNENNLIYTNFDGDAFDTKDELQKSINTTVLKNGFYVKTIPVFNKESKIEGCVLIMYKISLISANQNKIFILFILLLTISIPFLYIIIFTILISRKMAKKISEPINILVYGANQIKSKNLDFDIKYNENDELGDLCEAFSDMKDELKNSLIKQWKLENERIEIVESLAHDLKSPLSIIKVYLEVMSEDMDLNKEQNEYLKIIEKNTDKSISLVKQMRYTSDLDNSKLKVDNKQINIREFLKEKVEFYIIQSKEKEANISINVNKNVPEYIFVDVEKLERILDNLISNSIQYIDEKGNIKIEVDSDNDNIFYTISDDGVGFSKEDFEKAFNKFYRGDKARQGVHSGLGLYITKQLCEILDGDIEILDIGKGSKIKFHHRKIK